LGLVLYLVYSLITGTDPINNIIPEKRKEKGERNLLNFGLLVWISILQPLNLGAVVASRDKYS
jgi:hypothetical protein